MPDRRDDDQALRIVTGEVTEKKVTERVEKGSDRVVSPDEDHEERDHHSNEKRSTANTRDDTLPVPE